MPDKYGFDHLSDRGGLPIVACTEIGCGLREPKYLLNDDARREHFHDHIRSSMPTMTVDNEGRVKEIPAYNTEGMREVICENCGVTFHIPKQRGRPRKSCTVCKPGKV